MTRSQFTAKITKLLSKMIEDGAAPVIDHAMRSREEQRRLFDLGRSKCDGMKKLSRHQCGLAVDLYFVIDNQIDFGYNTPESKALSDKYHALWVEIGGNAMISWDRPHFEVS